MVDSNSQCFSPEWWHSRIGWINVEQIKCWRPSKPSFSPVQNTSHWGPLRLAISRCLQQSRLFCPPDAHSRNWKKKRCKIIEYFSFSANRCHIQNAALALVEGHFHFSLGGVITAKGQTTGWHFPLLATSLQPCICLIKRKKGLKIGRNTALFCWHFRWNWWSRWWR